MMQVDHRSLTCSDLSAEHFFALVTGSQRGFKDNSTGSFTTDRYRHPAESLFERQMNPNVLYASSLLVDHVTGKSLKVRWQIRSIGSRTAAKSVITFRSLLTVGVKRDAAQPIADRPKSSNLVARIDTR